MPTSTSVAACKTLALAAIALSWLNKDSLDLLVANIWNSCLRSRVFRHDSFEPLVVSISFLISMGFFYVLDNWISASKNWRIQADQTDMKAWKFEGGGRFKNEILWYWTPIALFDIIYPRRSLPLTPPSFFALCYEVIAGLFVYDLLFFVFHIALHKVPSLYERFHAKHHTKRVVRACETMRLSLMEEIIDVGCSIASLNILRCHPLSRAVYNFVIVYLITELHSGYDFPWMLQNVVPFGLWGGSLRHDYHHRYGTKYYQKFFTYLDDSYDFFMNRFGRRSKTAKVC